MPRSRKSTVRCRLCLGPYPMRESFSVIIINDEKLVYVLFIPTKHLFIHRISSKAVYYNPIAASRAFSTSKEKKTHHQLYRFGVHNNNHPFIVHLDIYYLSKFEILSFTKFNDVRINFNIKQKDIRSCLAKLIGSDSILYKF